MYASCQMKVVVFSLLITLLISFFPIIFLNKTFFFADNFMLMVPGKIFAAHWIKQGVIPLWNPYILTGVPFLADISQSLMYPSTLLFMFLSPANALSVSIVFHLFLGACGMAMLSYELWKNRYYSLFSAFSWMLSPILLAAVNNMSVTQSVSWIPWMIFFAMRICNGSAIVLSQILLVCSMTLSFFGGHPYPLFYGGILVALLVFAHPLSWLQKFQRFSLVMLLWITLSAVVLFPFLEAIGFSTRSRMSIAETTTGILQQAHALSLFVPNLYSDAAQGIIWGPDWGKTKTIIGYVSIIGMIAIIFLAKKWNTLSIQQRVLLGVGYASLLYLFGVFLPLMSSLYSIIPGFRFLRSPGEVGILWVISGGLLLGIALDQLRSWCVSHTKALLYLFMTMLGVLCVGWIAQLLYAHELWVFIDQALDNKLSQSMFHTEVRDVVIMKHVLLQVSIASVFLSLSLWALVQKRKILLLSIVALDFWIVSIPPLYTAPKTIFTTQSPQAALLQMQHMQNFRFLSLSGYLPWTGLPTYWDNMMIRPPFADSRFTQAESQHFTELQARRDNLAMDWGMPYSLSTPMGYGALILQSTADYWETVKNGASVNELDVVPLDDARLNEQGVKYLLVDKYVMNPEDIRTKNPRLKVVQDAATYAILENPDALPIVQTNDGSIEHVRIDVQGVFFQANMQQDGEVFIAQSWYPGWSCVYERGSCEIKKDTSGIRVVLPQGNWNVTLKFQYRNMKAYAAMSVGTLVGMLGWAGILWIKRGKQVSKRVK